MCGHTYARQLYRVSHLASTASSALRRSTARLYVGFMSRLSSSFAAHRTRGAGWHGISICLQPGWIGKRTQQHNGSRQEPEQFFHDASPLRRVRTVILCNLQVRWSATPTRDIVSGNCNDYRDFQVNRGRSSGPDAASGGRSPWQARLRGWLARGRRHLYALGAGTHPRRCRRATSARRGA